MTDTQVNDIPDIVGYNPADYEWENVHEEAPDKLVFDAVGDTYVGTYQGHELVDYVDEKRGERNQFVVLKWRDNDGLKTTNAGFELTSSFVLATRDDDGWITATEDKIKPDTVTRINLVKTIDVGQASPMKSFRVDVARASAPKGKKA